ncbi:MAG TPA: hypothetical protein VFW92_01580 [Candidatus Limnocylindrales bacterium]|nr:hypothetical protein [Candidatus Limnocylindrales bacterium]
MVSGAPSLRSYRLTTLEDDGADFRVRPMLIRAPVLRNERLISDYWQLTLDAPAVADGAQPGQFAMLTIARQDGLTPLLPRPMALCRWDRAAGSIDVVYRVVGEGTAALTTWRSGEQMTTVGPLGTGFKLRAGASTILLLGRGIGTCSLTALALRGVSEGVRVVAVASRRDKQAAAGAALYGGDGSIEIIDVLDTDGSSDPAAVRRELLRRFDVTGPDQIFVCGSERLLRLAADLGDSHGAEVQVSIEAHMACGIGYCHGCSSGAPGLGEEAPLVCTNGPAFRVARGALA